MPGVTDPIDPSRGYDALAEKFIANRSDIGARLVHEWAREHVPRGGAILDVGCGNGVPITIGLINQGLDVHAADASARMLVEFRARFPGIPTVQETVESGEFFAREFDAVIAVGVIFLLEEEAQRRAIANLARAIRPGGRLLFGAPWQTGEWNDNLTQQRSVSLGRDGYISAIERAGLAFVACHIDEGNNNHYEAIRPLTA